MRILEKSKRLDMVKVRVETEEDLWTLKTILREGDLVEGKTLREVSIKGSSSKERRPVIVKLRVKQVEFQPFTGKLRIFGVIEEGPEEYGLKGKHHSMIISPGQTIIIERKPRLPDNALRKLESSGPRGKAIIAAVDYDEYGLALIAPYGYKVLVESYMRLPGKDDPSREQELGRIIDKLARLIVDEAKRNDARIVIIVGPGSLKETLAGKVRLLAHDLRVETDDASMGGRAGIEEALRREKTAMILREYTVAEAEQVLEEFLRGVVRNPDKIINGIRELAYAASLGAVDKVVVVDELLYTMDDEARSMVDEALENVEKYRGRILLVPPDTPIGEKVKRLGGVVGLLRYPIPKSSMRLST
ncbi:MAG: mRNA surveillance protein Pelota [Desulfurococcales archaeon]|nr:mRNA surveillance protein Pelota [Desulfurococcales archaeon]